MAINDWPPADQPREKLLTHGARKLSDTELLAICLSSGSKGQSALQLAQSLLMKFGNLTTLNEVAPHELYRIVGLGPAKYAAIKAALELGARAMQPIRPIKAKLNSSQEAKNFFLHHLRSKRREVFACLFLDSQQRIINYEELFHGTIHEAPIYPREIVKRALFHNAAKMLIAHNHPSGIVHASKEDIALTHVLKQALDLIDVVLIDHIIVGDDKCYSLAEHGDF